MKNNIIKGRKMKTKIKMMVVLSVVIFTLPVFANNMLDEPCDSLETLKLYSLFSEYHKNRDYASALPYGWQVLECDKAKFAKWIYYKMEDCLWYIHDSSDVAPEEVQAIEDSMLNFYNMAIQYYPDAMAYFQVRKAFVAETWLELDPAAVIAEYEKAYEYNPDMDSYYLNRLGQLYIDNQSDDNDYYTKAIELYSDWAIKEPDNPAPVEKLKEIVPDAAVILDVYEKAWRLDQENLEKAWSYASACIRTQNYERAIEPLEFLTQKSPETINYWNQLATAYNKLGRLSDAEAAYQKLIQIDPNSKDYYFNLGIIYKEQGKLSRARQYFESANDKAGGWGTAIFSIGLLYEQSARDCTMDFKTKLVYLLAQDTYRRAVSIDPSLAQARDRISALSTSVPTQEDYFFNKKKPGDVIPITGECFGWINKSVTVPEF
jgi:tetratricopeptide (TPR) repeat protein